MNSRILTFYSWKGGVGRTMALANVAVQLARKGRRVLMVDWDLEAPGLDIYFSKNNEVGSFLISQIFPSDKTGLLGLLCDLRTESQQSTLLEGWKSRLTKITLSNTSELNHHAQASPHSEIDLLGSGHDSSGYSSYLGSFSWSSFFSEHNGGRCLENLRDQWKKHYDFILIDSRTGLTDAGGVCTVQMPDMLALVFTANTQSLDGGIKYLNAVERARENLAYERTPLTVFPLLARWEGDKEVDLSEEWLGQIESCIAPLVETWCPINLPIRRLLERLRVPHVARFSFGEPLPVLSHSLTDPDLPGLAYDLLANLISGPLSDAGTIIDPAYRTLIDISSEDLLDQLIKDEDARFTEVDRMNKFYGSNSPELNKLIYNLAARCLQLKKLRLANSFAKEAVDAARLLVSMDQKKVTYQTILSDALFLLAEVSQQQGSQTSALEAYQNVLNLLASLQEMNPANYDWGTKRGVAQERIGDIQRSMGNLEDALHSYREALASRSHFISIQLDRLGCQELKIVKEKVGDVLLELNDLKGAIIIYRECLAEMGASLNGPGVNLIEKDHGRIHEKIGKILIMLKDPIGALASYQEALSMKTNVSEDGLSYMNRRDLSEVYKQIGDLSADAEKFPAALSAYGKALLINASLAEEDPTDATKQRDFSSVKDKYEALLGQEIHCIAYSVPLEYRAQAPGRCQRQFIKKPKDALPGWRSPMEEWLDQWVERVDRKSPFTSAGLRTVEVQIDWRLISNSGVDEGVIRPVMGAGGWPLIPGSSIKGLFRRACHKEAPDRLMKWCGGVIATGEEPKLMPGLLRFHGAWPVDAKWTANLLDVAHPQQNWQVGFTQGRERHPAFGVVSLHRPKLQIALSSASSLEEQEWQEIETTLRVALDMGMGGRTCVGYGSSGRLKGDLLFECALEGQGPAAKLLDETPEFRPTMFRAAIRGMALRLFGGVTDPKTARMVVGRLFGSISPEDDKTVNVGLLATAYTDATCEFGSSGWPNYRQDTYATSGRLQWRQMRPYAKGEDEALVAELLRALHQGSLEVTQKPVAEQVLASPAAPEVP